MQVPILNGIYTDSSGDFRTSYPVNLIPVPKKQGIANGYLRPAEGIKSISTGPGVGRGLFNWNGILYGVMGDQLVKIEADGNATNVGTIDGSDRVSFDYSFDRLAVAASDRLYYYDGTTLTEVTDGDLGAVVDMIWIDGYFMTTDGEFLVVTELNAPDSVDPLKYGSSEVNPDPIKALLKLGNEVYALNRNTIEVFDNIGGSGFPFQRIESAQIDKGCVGTHACAVYNQAIAFVGGELNEPPSVYVGVNGSATKIATREVDEILETYTEAELSTVFMEVRTNKMHEHLLIHLPNKTLVFDSNATQAVGEPVWFVLSSSLDGVGKYRANQTIWCYDKWWTTDTDTSAIGYLTSETSDHWGDVVGWEFATDILYNEGRGAVVSDIELVCLNGRVALGKNPRISTQYTLDGMTWSLPRYIQAGKIGERTKRLIWLQQGSMQNWRAQRFNGTSDAFLSPVRLEARIEGFSH